MTPMPYSVMRFPPRKPVTPRTINPSRIRTKYTEFPPRSEPCLKERQRQAVRMEKRAVVAKARYW